MEKIASQKYIQTLKTREKSLLGLPKRASSGKPTRLFIDNEYITKGYLAFFEFSITAVYAILARHANQTSQTCFPSITLICKLLGTTCRPTAVNALKVLEKYGLIINMRAKGRGSSMYLLTDPAVWAKAGSIPIAELMKRKARHEQTGTSGSILNPP